MQPIALARCKYSPSSACVDAASWHTTVSTREDPLSLAAEIGERIEYKIWRGEKKETDAKQAAYKGHSIYFFEHTTVEFREDS